ncbi:MAG: SMP-30/gluconolactonase/LRE family protein [Proteobacteria bacterium]|nr:SMP-30/gluconolactonase/LRE family protein [Pseudomonadota bacterium]
MAVLEPLLAQRDVLGEGPVWCPIEQALYWVDIRKPAVYRYRPEGVRLTAWPMPSEVGSLALRQDGGILVALADRLAFFEPSTGSLETVANLPPGLRCNDGKCDRGGRFWVGTMHDDERLPVGALYRLDGDRTLRVVAAGLTIPNALAWSPDDRVMYHADSFQQTIYAYAFDAASGSLGQRRIFAKLPQMGVGPDGATVDAEGFLWNAEYGGGRLVRYAPDGRIERTVKLPVSQPTSCAFGGKDLDVLYVTSSRQRMRAEQVAKEPMAGGLFALDVGVKGLPEPRFAG